MKFPATKISFVITNIISTKFSHVKGKLSFFERKVMIFWKKWQSFLQKRIIIRSFCRIRATPWNFIHQFSRFIPFVFSVWTCPLPRLKQENSFSVPSRLSFWRKIQQNLQIQASPFCCCSISAAAIKKHPLRPKAEGMKELNNISNSF